MKLGVSGIAAIAALALVGCNGCQPTPAPAPAPPAPPADALSSEAVYAELVAAHCLSAVAGDAGAATVAAEHAGPNPPWLNCLYQPSGNVTSCAVPCSKP